MSFEEAQEFWNDIIPETRRRDRIFVSFPFASNPVRNKLLNLELLYVLRDTYPSKLFISPLELFNYLQSEEGIRDDIMEFCKGLISYLCDEVWSFGESEGVVTEREYAKRAGVPVYIKNIKEYLK